MLLFEHVHAESRDRGQAMVDCWRSMKRSACSWIVENCPIITAVSGVLKRTAGRSGERRLVNVAPILALLGGRLKQREASGTRYLTPCCNWQEVHFQVTVHKTGEQ